MDTPNAKRFRIYLETYSLGVCSTPLGLIKRAFNNIIIDVFSRQERPDLEEEKTLRVAIKVPKFKEACVRLITIRNLPFLLLD